MSEYVSGRGAIIAGYLCSSRPEGGIRAFTFVPWKEKERDGGDEGDCRSARDYASLRYLSTMLPYRPRPFVSGAIGGKWGSNTSVSPDSIFRHSETRVRTRVRPQDPALLWKTAITVERFVHLSLSLRDDEYMFRKVSLIFCLEKFNYFSLRKYVDIIFFIRCPEFLFTRKNDEREQRRRPTSISSTMQTAHLSTSCYDPRAWIDTRLEVWRVEMEGMGPGWNY